MNPELFDPDRCYRSLASDAFLREKPDEEDEEEHDDGNEGYSE
jgi:hypothetical protein